MKKVLIGILALVMVLGFVGCSLTPTEETNTAEPTENPIEVADDIVVTFDDFIKILNEEKISYSLDFNKIVLNFMEIEDGFSFKCDDGTIENISIFGNTDKDENLTSIKIVCEGVIVDWIEDKEAIKDFNERYMKADAKNMSLAQLKAYNRTHDAIKMVKMVYALISNKAGTLDAVIEILTSDNPVSVGKWSIFTILDENNSTVTIEANYNE